MTETLSSTCDCCEGITTQTPADLENPPRQPTIHYRVGVHGAFKASMLARLSQQPALQALTTRHDDDPTIALIDAWATTLDVLTFYQERIANEGYLRTATERRSLLELARSTGYELQPGVAANTFLAFDMETAPGAPTQAKLAVGSRVQSVPGQDEKAQTYETIEEIEARPQWNRIALKATQTQTLTATTTFIYLKTLTTQVQKGDALLFVSAARQSDLSTSKRWALRMVSEVKLETANDRTRVTLDAPLGSVEPTVNSADNPTVYGLRQRAALFGHNAPDWTAMSKEIRCAYDPPSCNAISLAIQAANQPVAAQAAIVDNASQLVVQGTFNAHYMAQPATDWPGIGGINGGVIDLDATYAKLVSGSWLVLETASKLQLYKAKSVATPSIAKFMLAGKATRITPFIGSDLNQFPIRETAVFAQSELLELAEVEWPTLLSGDQLLLSTVIPNLPAGRQLFVAGTSADGELIGEVAKVKSVVGTTVTLEKQLQNSYVRSTVTVYGNLAAATHGETRNEVLGSGDAGQSFQKFALKNVPVTYVAADTPSGSSSTLEVSVNTIAWTETPSFFGHDGRDRVFITRTDDEGKTTVQFGDGINGARLPAGVENVNAHYRVGSGVEGLVKAKQLSLLMTRPLGLKSVLNPLPPTGADDAETRDEARENAPRTVLTFDRIVSLSDFANFARAFAGVAKAQAASLWQQGRQTIFVTIAGAQGAAIPPSNPLQAKLRSAIRKAGATLVYFDLLSYSKLSFALKAEVIVKPNYLADKVLNDVRIALEQAFSFAQRDLGQSLQRSAVIAVIQRVAGVQAVNVSALHFTTQPATREDHLPAHPTRRDASGTILPAELVMIDPAQIDVRNVTVFGA